MHRVSVEHSPWTLAVDGGSEWARVIKGEIEGRGCGEGAGVTMASVPVLNLSHTTHRRHLFWIKLSPPNNISLSGNGRSVLIS